MEIQFPQTTVLDSLPGERVKCLGGLANRHPKLGLVADTLAPATALCIPKWAVPGNAVLKSL